MGDDAVHAAESGQRTRDDRAVDISVLVPVMDEAASIERLTDEVRTVLDGRTPDDIAGSGWELIFIDDGSRDGSWEEISRLAKADERVQGLRLRRNFGKSAALAAGLESSTGRGSATICAASAVHAFRLADRYELTGAVDRSC